VKLRDALRINGHCSDLSPTMSAGIFASGER
jgi:hypothetical protein